MPYWTPHRFHLALAFGELTIIQALALQVQKLEEALAGATASVEGTIQNVTYKDEKSGYAVLRVTALRTAGEPPEQRINAAKTPSRAVKG